MSNTREHHGGRGETYAPPEYSVQRGTVARIEPYGAFVQLDDYRAQGMVHLSQLAKYKVESVNDAVSLNDVVWVKVMEVTEEKNSETGKTRHRVRLSMKYVSQDDGTDLDPTNEEMDDEMSRISASSGRNERSAVASGSRHDPPSALEQNLNSRIGMGIAIDPLAAMRQGTNINRPGGLVLKSQQRAGDASGQGPILFNGYALVDDEVPGEEGTEAPVGNQSAAPRAPLGRGRGTTLPAWMTATASNEGPTGMKNDAAAAHDERSQSSSRSREKKRKKRSRHQDRHEDDRDRHRSRRSSRHRKRHHKLDRERRKSSGKSSRRKRKRSRSSKEKGRRRSYSIDSRSSSTSRSDKSYRGDSTSDDGGDQFRSVEEAKALIARLENEKGRQKPSAKR